MSKCEFKTTIQKKIRISTDSNEKGLILIAALALISILALMATLAVTTTYTDIKISSNYKTSVQALHAAQAGIEEARARLRGSSSDDNYNYAGDPAVNPDPTWSAYILTSSSWQTSDDPNYNGIYTNYIPTTSNHTNSTIGTNTIQTAPDISYWVKIRHKRETDCLPNETWIDNGGTTNDIIYYGYATSTSTTAVPFTSDDVPFTASPVEIITSYGSSGKSSSIIEIQARKLPGSPIVGSLYANTISGSGSSLKIIGNDACASASVPAVAYFTSYNISGNPTLESDAGTSTQLLSAIDLGAYVDALESTATIILDDDDDPLQNYTVGSDTNYEIVFCDATQLSDKRLNFKNLTGYGTLVVRGDTDLKAGTTWHGHIIASGDIRFIGGGNKVIYGTIMADEVYVAGAAVILYSSCEIDNANDSYRLPTSRWKDKKLN